MSLSYTERMDPWELLDIYFRDHLYPFTKHHLDSYREFLRTHIPNTIRSFNPITMLKEDAAGQETLRVEVFVGDREGDRIYLERPTVLDGDGKPMLLTPQDARIRDQTYNTHLFADVRIDYYKDGASTPISKHFPMTFIASIPLMLHSEPCVLHGQGSKVLQGLGECAMDPGGYFIVDGKEKVIVSQERIATNRLFIRKTDDDEEVSLAATINCNSETNLIPRPIQFFVVRKETPGAILVALPSIKGRIPLSVFFRALGAETDKQIVELVCGDTAQAIPPPMLDFLRPSLAHGASLGVYTIQDALEYMRRRTTYDSAMQVRAILATDVFPHMPDDPATKAAYLGYLVSQLQRVALGMEPPSDRDSYIFKRVDISGFLLAQLFQTGYGAFRKNVRDLLDYEYHYSPWKNIGGVEELVRAETLARVFNSTLVTDLFHRSLKGMWGSDDDPEQGKVQDLARISYIGFLSHLRRVNMPLDRSIKLTSPHRLHSQQWGIMCPFESPDGASIGYLKNFALMTQITFGTLAHNIAMCLDDLEVERIENAPVLHLQSRDHVRVFINGTWHGVTQRPETVVRALRLFRRNALLNPFVSIAWNIVQREIRIQTEAGRPCRPLLLVDPATSQPVLARYASSNSRPTWYDLVFGARSKPDERSAKGYYKDKYVSPFGLDAFQHMTLEQILGELEKTQAAIEYLDIEEENTSLVAMDVAQIGPFHTHVEIHPSTIFSVVTQIVPFANHNQAPRVIFHGAQSKQAIGIYATNFHKRFDTMGYVQHYPQKRIVTTRGSHYNGNDRMPNGANVIVAIATYTGFNQEDGIILNKSSVDRGLFHVTAYKTLVAKEKALSPTESLVFGNPIRMRDAGKAVEGIKNANWSLLDERGIVKEESYIPRGQEAAVMGMLHVSKHVRERRVGVFTQQVVEETYRDASRVTDVHHYGKIDRVFVAQQMPGNPNRICKVRFRKVRRPELGDKSCSAHGQKGVVGMILPQEDMPFTKDGIVPDIIINPHAFPSRMTMGHLVETVMAKMCCLEGSYGDGTVFLPFDSESLFNNLESHGFERHGNEIMYNGRTGEQLQTEIFMGPVFYYRLKHMVTDKIHSRNGYLDKGAIAVKGPRVQLTQQPTSGRSKQGGLRIGEMERDVLLGHGLAQFAKECMMEKSDRYTWAVCRTCGVLAKYASGGGECLSCGENDLATIRTPYAFKLLIQELEAMGVQIRIHTDGTSAPPEDDVYEDEDEGTPAPPPIPLEVPQWGGEPEQEQDRGEEATHEVQNEVASVATEEEEDEEGGEDLPEEHLESEEGGEEEMEVQSVATEDETMDATNDPNDIENVPNAIAQQAEEPQIKIIDLGKVGGRAEMDPITQEIETIFPDRLDVFTGNAVGLPRTDNITEEEDETTMMTNPAHPFHAEVA
jgi:DNA-directed RNA polymerase II subunit RPB2